MGSEHFPDVYFYSIHKMILEKFCKLFAHKRSHIIICALYLMFQRFFSYMRKGYKNGKTAEKIKYKQQTKNEAHTHLKIVHENRKGIQIK